MRAARSEGTNRKSDRDRGHARSPGLGRSSGMTLLELLVVMMILSLILTAAVKTWDVTLERGRFDVSQRKLHQIATVIVGNRDYVVSGNRVDFGYVGDIGALPQDLNDLATRPAGFPAPEDGGTWRGPYIRATFQEAPGGFRIDGWGDTITYSPESLFVRSYGGKWLSDPTQWLTRMFGYTAEQLLNNTVSGQVLDARGMPPGDKWSLGSGHFLVWLQRPDPVAGVIYGDTLNNFGSAGQFDFGAVIPQGNRTELYVRYIDSRDQVVLDTTTVHKAITVYPGSGARDIQIRLNVNWDDYPDSP